MITIDGKVWSNKSKKWLSLCNNGLGYLKVQLWKNKKGIKKYVHRLVATHFISRQPKNKPYVNHKDLKPSNNHVDNLEWVSQKQNIQHAVKNGRELGHIRKLKPYIKDIFELYYKGLTQQEIAMQFNVDQANISRVINLKAYKKEGLKYVCV